MRDYKLRKKVFNDYLDTSKLPAKTDAMTMPVGVDEDGNLWAEGSTPTGTINITQNGVIDVTNYASANVNVSGSTPSIEVSKLTLTITASGDADVYIFGLNSDKVPTVYNVTSGMTLEVYMPRLNGSNSGGVVIMTLNGTNISVSNLSTALKYYKGNNTTQLGGYFVLNSSAINCSAKVSLSNT